jgi:hypothetical protein
MTNTTTHNRTPSYPYAYGSLDAGIRTFANHFEMMARMKGFDIDEELFAYMAETLVEMGDSVREKACDHHQKWGS